MKFKHLLLEISLQDHYTKYMASRYPDMDEEQYMTIASIDPTTKNGQRGKYVEWLVKMFHDVVVVETVAKKLNKYLEVYSKASGVKDLNQFTSVNEFIGYIERNSDKFPLESKKQIKQKEKEIFNVPEDIQIIDVTDEWIVARPITQEGNIKLARWKTSESAQWCTADPKTCSHWKGYKQRGELIVFLNRDNPREKYQIAVDKNGNITESKDFDNQHSDTPIDDIIPECPNIEKNFMKIQKIPLYLILDHYGIADYFLNEEFEHDRYTNRTPSEAEYENGDVYNADVEFQLGSFSRYQSLIDEGFDFYKNMRKFDSDDKMRFEDFVSFFSNTRYNGEGMGYVSETHTKDSEQAIEDWYRSIDDEYDEYVSNNYEDDPMPVESEYDDRFKYEDALYSWKSKVSNAFIQDNKKLLEYVDLFREEFPWTFQWELNSGYDNSDQQLNLPFEEKILQKYKNML